MGMAGAGGPDLVADAGGLRMSHPTRPREVFPSLFGSKRWRRLSRDGQLVFVWMIVVGDDQGRGDLDLDLLAGQISQSDPMTPEETHAALRLIDQTDIAIVYQVAGEWYYQITNPLNRVRADRIRASTYPPADCGEARRFAALFPLLSSLQAFGSKDPHAVAVSESQQAAADRGESRQEVLELDAEVIEELSASVNEQRLAEARELLMRMLREAIVAGNDENFVRAYWRAAIEAIEAHYERVGGSFTPTRKLNMARRLSRVPAYAILVAIEIYVDFHAPQKDYRFLCGIAARLAPMSENQLDLEAGKNRNRAGAAGLYAVTNAAMAENALQAPNSPDLGVSGTLPPSEAPEAG